MIRICPLPPKWLEIHEKLKSIARKIGVTPPLGPLILGGWVHSSDSQKIQRWEEHVAWAEAHGARTLIDTLKDEDFYFTHKLTYPREWDWSLERIPPATRPSDEQLRAHLTTIQCHWEALAKDFSKQTVAMSFSGKKAHQLNVNLLAREPLPPWGTWGLEKIGLHSHKFTQKARFSDFRKSINILIAPHKINHIKFFYMKRIPNTPSNTEANKREAK